MAAWLTAPLIVRSHSFERVFPGVQFGETGNFSSFRTPYVPLKGVDPPDEIRRIDRV